MDWVKPRCPFTMIVPSLTCSPSSRAESAPLSRTPGESPSIVRPVPRFSLEEGRDETGPVVWIRFPSASLRGVWIECRSRTGEWEFLALTLERAHLDRLPPGHLAETAVREYRARYFDRMTIGGPWSAVQKIAIETSRPRSIVQF